MSKELDGVYNFSDAVTAVQEYINQLRDQQKNEAGPNEKGLYQNWDLFYIYQGTIESLEYLAEALTHESVVAELLRAADEREN